MKLKKNKLKGRERINVENKYSIQVGRASKLGGVVPDPSSFHWLKLPFQLLLTGFE